MSDEQNEFLFTEIYVDTAEIVPIKFSLRFTFDIITSMHVFPKLTERLVSPHNRA